jgi:membrane fusion protein (multidrug efflux system)
MLRFLKQLLVILAALAAIAAVGWWVWDLQRSRHAAATSAPASAAKLARVTTVKIETRPFTDQIEAVGTLLAQESASISANVTEAVVELRFDDGQPVKAGDILARLDSVEEEATREAARAALAEQSREINRLSDLVKQGAAPAVRLEERETLAELARRRLEEAEAKLADRKIVAPFDGIVGLRRISVGALVTPGTVIATLDQISRMKLDFTVPESFLSDLKPGLKIAAVSTAYPDRKFEGTVTQIDSRIDPVTRSVAVRAEIPNPDGELRPGMLMTTLLHRNPRTSPAVPERAVVPVGRESFVYLVRRTPDGKASAERVPIKAGAREPGIVEALSGLKPGDEIVTDGVMGLTTGAPLQIDGEFGGASPAYNPRKG